MILEIFKMWNRIFVEDCLTCPVNLWWFRVLMLYPAATKDCRLTHGINQDYRKTFLEINFLRLIQSESFSKNSQSDNVQRNREAVPEAGRTKTTHTSEDRQNQGTIPMPTFATRPSTASSTMPVELPQNYIGRIAKTADIGIAIRQVP